MFYKSLSNTHFLNLTNANTITYHNATAMFLSMTPLPILMARGGVDLVDKKALDVQVGHQIKKAREAAGYTQDKFAELIGMGVKNVSAIERGVVGVSLSTVKKICETLHISSDSLIMDEPCDTDTDKMDFLVARIKRLPPKQFDLALDFNNKIFEAFTLQISEPAGNKSG